MIRRLGRWWWLLLAVALLAAFPVARASMENRPVTSFAQVIYTWAMTFGLMGCCRRLLRRENPVIRYLSDSSYFLYLAHLPLIIAAQVIVRDWPLRPSRNSF